MNTAKVLQDLSVLVAQVETGAFVDVDDPNYALLSSATQTIKTLLNRVLSGPFTSKPPSAGTAHSGPAELLASTEEEWIPWTTHDNWDFELEFWNNLAEHPILTGNAEGTSYFR